MQKSIKLKLLNIFFYIVLVFGFYFFLENNKTLISVIIFQNIFFYFVVLLKFSNFLVFNQLHLSIFNIYNLQIKKIENFELTFKGYIGNFFGFGKSGTGYKALVLKNKYNFSYSKFVSFYIFLQTLTLFGTTFICFTILTFSNNFQYKNRLNLFFLLIGIMIVCIFANFFLRVFSRVELLKNIKFLNKIIISFDLAFSNISKFKLVNNEIFKIIFFQILIQINLFFQIYLQASTLGIDMSLLSNFVYNIISQISIFLSVTPNSIGIKEFFLVISNEFIGLSSFEVFDLAIVDRVTDFLSLLLFVIIYRSIKKLLSKN